MRVKKVFAGIIVVLVAACAINSCNDLDSSDVNQAQSSSQVVEYKEVPKGDRSLITTGCQDASG